MAEPEDGPADKTLLRVLQASWQQVGTQARLLDRIGSALGPRAAEMHTPVRERLLKLSRRGRRDGTFRRDVPERWLMTTYFTLVHAAGHEVTVGNATYGEAEKALSQLLLGAFSPDPALGEFSRCDGDHVMGAGAEAGVALVSVVENA